MKKYKYQTRHDWSAELRQLDNQYDGCYWSDCPLELLLACVQTKYYVDRYDSNMLFSCIIKKSPVWELLYR